MPTSASATVRVGIDVGGTFTDAVIVRDGALSVAKVPTTPADIATGFIDGLDVLRAADDHDIGYLVHGTTVATNAIVQRRLARTGLITNEGFRDILEIGTQMRPHIYDLWTPLPPPLVARELCVEIDGRLAADGSEVTPLTEASVAAAAGVLREAGVESIAVVLLFSFANDGHEQAVRKVLAAELPGVPVALSCEVAPEFREYLRASTTVLNAALLPLVGGYVSTLSNRLDQRGVAAPLHLMRSNGGVATAATATELPVGLTASGPAAGVIGAARLAERVGETDLLTFDMGGTTADVALVVDGLPQLRFTSDQGGYPVNLPQVDVLSVGAGGGSIAAVDDFGSLTVGPASAGAVPGPACYGQGGGAPTVTDAHLVLANLGPARALGGRLTLSSNAAREVIRVVVAEPLERSVEEAAEAIVRVAVANMAAALRVVSVARGHDPRALTLVCLGGAGPMHACAIADDLGCPRIVVPRHPGVTAALGLLLSEVRHDLRLSWIAPTQRARADPALLDHALAGLERRGRTLLAASGHDASGRIDFELDMRYCGQAYNLTIPLAPRPVTAETVATAEDAFVEAHCRAYDYTPSLEDTEIVTIRARATVAAQPIRWADDAASSGAGAGAETQERMVFHAGAWCPFAVVERGALAAGRSLAGPAIVEQEDSTLVVAPGWIANVRAEGILVLERVHP